MADPILIIFAPLSLAVFSLAARRVFELKDKRDLQGAWGWFFLSLVPASGLAFYIIATQGAAVTTRNLVLGTLGAILGGSAAIWTGYVVQGSTASAQAPTSSVSPSPAPSTPPAQPTLPPITGSGTTVLSIGQSGGVTAGTYVNQAMVPELRVISSKSETTQNGNQITIIQDLVVSQVTPAILHLEVRTAGLISTTVRPPVVLGTFQSGVLKNIRATDNSYSVDVESPSGEYEIVVVTKDKSPISLGSHF